MSINPISRPYGRCPIARRNAFAYLTPERRTVRALIFETIGEPCDVLRLEDIEETKPAQGEVLLQMLFSPVNPSDLHMVRGRYGYQPSLPASPGAEGVGIVLEVGPDVTNVHAGDRVICIGTWNLWRETAICKASNVVPVSDTISDEAAATCYQNPLTAWALTQSVKKLKRGEWVLQTAAASSVGRLVLQLSKIYGFRTINVIHRRVQAGIIGTLGGDEVVCTEDEDLRTRLQQITGGKGIEYAIDCVAGDVGGEIVRNLASGGMLVQFGALSSHRQTDPAKFLMPVFSPKLIYSAAYVRGWWIPRWLETQPIESVRQVITELLKMIGEGRLTLPPTTSVPLQHYKKAIAMADGGSSEGKKVLLGLSNIASKPTLVDQA
jgi:NADPH:quinone reductase-like Zn-dependent oxidoreductase